MLVKVYKNLHNGKFSIVSLEPTYKNRVIGYADEITLSNVSFKVSKAGRERVLREKRKNVHAYVIGSVEAIQGFEFRLLDIKKSDKTVYFDNQVRYNPYKFETFVVGEQLKPINKAQAVTLTPQGMTAKV